MITIILFFIILLIYFFNTQENTNEIILVTFISVVFILFIFIINSLSSKIEKDAKKFQSFIDTLDDFVIIRSPEKVYSINQSFLSFFNVKNLNEFIQTYECITKRFIKKEDCIDIDLNKVDDSLIEKINSAEESKRAVEILDKDSKVHRLAVKISKIDQSENLYSIVLSNITKENHFEKHANTDTLTNILSRYKFNELYTFEFARSLRYFNPLAILFLDIDHFKKINDKFGHDIGDETLKMFTKTISSNIREFDKLARWGGEEFILMLPQTTIKDAYRFGEKIRKIIEKHKFNKIENLTCSIGISVINKGDNPESLIKRADIALYKAKNSGRNRTIIEI